MIALLIVWRISIFLRSITDGESCQFFLGVDGRITNDLIDQKAENGTDLLFFKSQRF